METPLLIQFDAEIFSVLAVQKACYRFSKTASFEVQKRFEGTNQNIHVTISPISVKSQPGMEHLVKQLRNEVIDQQLREQIGAKTEGVRNLILAHAFSKTGLIAVDEGFGYLKDE